MDELWSSASYEPHALSLLFAFAPTALLLVIAYAVVMRGSPALRGWLLLHCAAVVPYALAITVSPSTTSPHAAAQWFRFGASFISLAAAAGTGLQLAMLRKYRRYRAWIWFGVASSLVWGIGGSVTDWLVPSVHRIEGGLWFADAGRFGLPSVIHTIVLAAVGFVPLAWTALGPAGRALPANERRQLRLVLLANTVTYSGLVDLLLAWNVGVFPIGWLTAGVGSLVVLRAILVEDLLRVRAVDTRIPRLFVIYAAGVGLAWSSVVIVGEAPWWGTALTLLLSFVSVRIAIAIVALVNRGARTTAGPLDRLLAQLTGRARGLTRGTEIAQLALDIVELGLGERVDILLASDADWGWTRASGERLADDEAPDPLLGTWLAEHRRTVFADDPDREVPADLAPLIDRLLATHHARALIPIHAGDELLGAIAIPTSAGRLRGASLAFLERVGDRTSEALVHARMAAQAALRANVARDVELAQAVQAELLPPRGIRTFGELAVIGSWRPATSCAGDFWGVYPLDDTRTLIAIGDATGHGIASAMVTAAAVGACDAAARDAGPALRLEDLVLALDVAVRRVSAGELALTCFAAVIDQRANTIRYVSCGHAAPYLLRWSGEPAKAELAALVGRGNPLGGAAPPSPKVHERPLAAGDLVVWYTDGVIEAHDRDGKPFGDRRLQQLLRKLDRARAIPTLVHDAMQASLAAHRAGLPLADDETIVVAQLIGGGTA